MSTATRYQDLAQALAEEIATQYTPGDLLPSEVLLAKRFSVSPNTASRAVRVLVERGVVRRYHRRGTVVLDRKAVGEIAIILRPQLFSADTHPYYSLINGLLIKLLQEHNPRWQIRLHLGKNTETGDQFPATLDLQNPDVLRNLRGVFTHHSLYGISPLLSAAKVPVVGLHNRETPQVWFDTATLYNLGLAHLKEAGCKTVGMIWAAISEQQMETHDSMVFFRRAAEAHGFTIQPQWTAPSFADKMTEQDGYQAMLRLWQNQSHPDGILVVDDMMCRGVLRAALQLGIDFPRDVRLVTNSNCGITLNYHKPVSRVEFDPVEEARLAVDMMLTLMDGRAPASAAISLPGVLIKGETT